jgi:hypothetical protein
MPAYPRRYGITRLPRASPLTIGLTCPTWRQRPQVLPEPRRTTWLQLISASGAHGDNFDRGPFGARPVVVHLIRVSRTTLPGPSATVLSRSNLGPVPIKKVPAKTVMNLSFGWE